MDESIFQNKIIEEDIKEISSKFDKWRSFQDKTILITGANGHIANYIAYVFAYQIIKMNKDITLLLLSRNLSQLKEKYSHIERDKIRLVAQDVSDPIDIGSSVDYIFHFAGNASPYFIKNDPVGILKANILGTFNIADLARQHGSKIIFSSSREVYGEVHNKFLLNEKDYGVIDLLEKRSCYPESKRASEVILNSYLLQYNVPYLTVRIAHCYGPGMKITKDGRVIQDFIGDAVNGTDIVMKSDGKALRAFCYISDVVRCILELSVSGKVGQAYNISNETEEISVGELATRIAAIEGSISIIKETSANDFATYCSYERVGLDCSKAYSYGWQPLIDLETGLTKTINSFKQ